MKKHLHLLLTFGSLLLIMTVIDGCPRPIPPPNPPPVPVTPLDHPATCADVCQRMFVLGCPASEPTSSGATCLDVCMNIISSGVLHWDLECMAKATSCPSVDACN